MKLLVIDGQVVNGQGPVEEIKTAFPDQLIIAVGTNSIATSTMLKAGADMGATGENPVIYNCRDADVIIGPIGIIRPIPAGRGHAGNGCCSKRFTGMQNPDPSNKCNSHVVGTQT